jgi:hypothetical protein
MSLYQAIETFFAGDAVECVNAGDLYEEDDPFVRHYPSKFKPAPVKSSVPVRSAGRVEQATAAPGEKRQRA